jgi:hypothetical protein
MEMADDRSGHMFLRLKLASLAASVSRAYFHLHLHIPNFQHLGTRRHGDIISLVIVNLDSCAGKPLISRLPSPVSPWILLTSVFTCNSTSKPHHPRLPQSSPYRRNAEMVRDISS